MTFLELKNGERARTNLSMGLGYLGREHLCISPVAEPPWPHTGPAAARGLVQLVLNEHAELVPGDPASQWNISLSAARFQSRDAVRLRLAPRSPDCMGWSPPRPGFLGSLRELVHRMGVCRTTRWERAPPSPDWCPPAVTFVGQTGRMGLGGDCRQSLWTPAKSM